MSSTLQTIDTEALVTATGGNSDSSNGAPNRGSGSANVGVTTPGGLQVGVQTQIQRQRSDYGQCLDRAMDRGFSADQIRDLCGRPPGAQ
jgi:hypothetical protein